MWAFTVVLALVESAAATEGPAAEAPPADAPPAEAAPEVDPRQALDAAVALYAEGSTVAARVRIQEILALGPSLDSAVRVDALAWLGDILFVEQGLDAAREPFAALLAEDPDYHLDRFTHADAVVDAFEQVRASLRPPVTVPPPLVRPDPSPWPWLCLVPGGAVYYPQKRVGVGLAFGGAQALGFGASLWSRVEMQQVQKRASDVRENDPEVERLQGQYDRLKAVNVAAVVVGWGAYLTPVVWETSRWGATATVGVGPGGVRVGGRF